MTDSTFDDIQKICDVLTKAKAQRCTEVECSWPIRLPFGDEGNGKIWVKAKWEKRND